ncbi:DUF5047 domain-containing protein [Streptomyces celluloflavus]|uniref:DUF5047 domain-containing protein n=1 Tax=Streptomyces celluloflavus TaxID=58344 RepID=UPI003666CD4D
MYPVSARFLAAIAESHQLATVVQLFRTDGAVTTLPHTGGSVTVDRTADCRRTCTVEIADPTLIPRIPAAALGVYGALLRISRGVRYSDGQVETVPLGVFRLDEISGDPDTGPVTLAGKSLEVAVGDDAFTVPTRVTGTAVGAVTTLIQATLPSATILNRAADAPIGPRSWDVGHDRWAAVAECAAAIGAEVYADPDGNFVVSQLPDILTTTPVWTIAAGLGGAYIEAARGMSANGVYNGVHASGENTEAGTPPVSALVVDSDPTSPTYWGGPYGRRPYFYSSSTLTSVNACTQAAGLLLRQMAAPIATASITSLANPALEPGDTIRVVYPDGSKEIHQVSSFSLSLDTSGVMELGTISAKGDG